MSLGPLLDEYVRVLVYLKSDPPEGQEKMDAQTRGVELYAELAALARAAGVLADVREVVDAALSMSAATGPWSRSHGRYNALRRIKELVG